MLLVPKVPCLLLTLLLAACSGSAQQQARVLPPTDVVATVGATSITLTQLDGKALQIPASSFGPVKLVQALYEARRAALDEIIATTLIDQEAKARGMASAALTALEVTSKAEAVDEADVMAWYQSNQARVQGAPLDQVRAPIRQLLAEERLEAARQRYLDTLKMKTPVKIVLEPPRQTVAEAGRAAQGPANAPIQMIEFSDFQCPYCLRAYPTLMKVLQTYGDRIRFVYRHYPLKNHPQARPAAEAAQCANEQGKFWPYHNHLFSAGNQLSDADLKQAAVAVGADPVKFNACFDSHKYSADVDTDIAAADEAGVTGTPAFFINGRMLTGAQPLEAFKRLIDEELELKNAR